MKPQSMEEKISYRLFFMGFVGLVCTAVLCLFVFHKAFREQAWTSLEHQADLVSAGYEQLFSPDQVSVFVNGDLRITLIAAEYWQCGCYNSSLCIHVSGLSHMMP